MRNSQPPTRRADAQQDGQRNTLDHDAFGTVTLTTIQGGGGVLFGSDVTHDHRVRITVNRAELSRDLSSDFIYSGARIVEFEMSHAQFAQFITSNGRGDGTPVTLCSAPPRGVRIEMMPGIQPIESKQETFRREIEEAAAHRLDEMTAAIDKLGALLASGKIGKTELRELHAELARHARQLPGSLSFVLAQAEEALEQATTHAKIDVETFISTSISRLGHEKAAALGLLKEGGTKE